MPAISKAQLLFAVAFAICFSFAGCGGGPPTQKAKGQILVDGKNYQVRAKEQLQVIFYPDVENLTAYYPSEVKSDGSFETVGMEGHGIPPGKYRVAITSPYGGGSVAIPKQLGTKASPIVREIVKGKETIEPIDITKPAG